MFPETQAPCGINCAECEAWQATQADDGALKLKVLEKWRREYSPDVPLEAVSCDGCVTAGCRKGGYTGMCPIRACATGRNQLTCAHCGEYETCQTLAGFLAQAGPLREKLQNIRARLSGA